MSQFDLQSMSAMDEPSAAAPPMGSRHLNLKKSFKLGTRSLLTAISKEDVWKAFPTFNDAERQNLYRMIVQVIKSLHQNIEEEFESICQETQVGTALDTIEELVEEQNLDVLATDKTDIRDIREKMMKAKKDEIQYLMSLLQKAEGQNSIMKAHIESLKEKRDRSITENVAEKLRSWNADYQSSFSS